MGHSSAHVSQAGFSPVGVAARNGRSTPPPNAWSEPTGGARAGTGSPPPRSPGKAAATRDQTPVKTHKPTAIRANGSALQLASGKKQMRVAITLMTRKPHRFDW